MDMDVFGEINKMMGLSLGDASPKQEMFMAFGGLFLDEESP